MPVVEVMSVPSSVPSDLLDRLMTATEEALIGAGAARVWIDPTSHQLTVRAELPAVVPAEVRPR